jgi:hypothetical protein
MTSSAAETKDLHPAKASSTVGPNPLSLALRFFRDMTQRERVRQRLALFTILTLGGTLRLFTLGAVGLNSDEAVYLGQAASLAQVPELNQLFPIFRAHPLLIQSILSLTMRSSASDVGGRLVAVTFGVGTVWIVYAIGREMYSARAGLYAALFLAVMPYHVIVTRQVLLDGPMTLFAAASLLFAARFASSGRPSWLYGLGAALGLTILSKETAVVLLASVYAFLAVSPELRLRVRDLLLATGAMAAVISAYPISLLLAGGVGTNRSQQYLIWQLSRRPNHEWDFYPTAVAPAIGIPLLLLALAALIYFHRNRDHRRVLLGAWIAVPLVFFQLWPVKGFHYLLATAPPIAVLAGYAIHALPDLRARDRLPRGIPRSAPRLLLTAAVTLLLVIQSINRISGPSEGRFLAGSGGVPGGREAGLWLRENSPEGSTLMTIGPSMANILQFYSQRRAFGLSVSPNPLHRNPAYQPIRNPDFELRTGEIQYVVWDAYSAGRSSFFSDKILNYADRYDGRAVHTETISVTTPSGESTRMPVIIIYEVRP